MPTPVTGRNKMVVKTKRSSAITVAMMEKCNEAAAGAEGLRKGKEVDAKERLLIMR
jgi:hypothetical protein